MSQKLGSVVLLNKKIHILLSQVYCVRQVVKTPTIILNNPVSFRSDGVRGQIYAPSTVLCTRLGALRGWFVRCAQEKKSYFCRESNSTHQSSALPAPFRTCDLCRKLARLFFFYFVNVVTSTLSSSSYCKHE